MRLRLCVQRNGLPPTNVVWSVPDINSPQAYTIARLLEDVNQILPIEAEEWGYEDYIVEVGGYECLHFAPVFQALKEDDLVSIRPLLTAEVRARTLSGRYQISDGGQHLVDGIPFGRPYLRNPSRPSVSIPSRKRKRALEDDTALGLEDAEKPQLITANGEEGTLNGGISDAEAGGDAPHETRRRSGTKRVRFEHAPKQILGVSELDDDLDEEDDGDFEPGGSEDSDASMENASNDDSDTSDESSVVSDTSSEDTDSSSDTSSESDSGSSVPEEPIGRQPVAPNKGKSGTQNRNKRRKLSLKLRNLQKLEILPSNARRPEFEEWEGQDESAKEQQLAQAQLRLEEKKRKSALEEPRTGRTAAESDAQNLENAKQILLSKYGQEDSEEAKATTPAELPEKLVTPAPAQEPPRKRLRPNISAITRIIGHQARPLKKPAAVKPEPAPVEEVPVDPIYWKSKVTVSAFECWFEDVELSAPPFPFKQHWDPASREMRERDKAKQNKKRKKASNELPAVPPPEDELVQLDYGDDTGALMRDNIDHEAAVDAQLIQEVHAAAKIDLPPLPDSVDLLPPLTKDDLKVGTIVAFKVMEFAPGTMMPAISNFKTAIIEKLDESGEVGFRLAERDVHRKEKKYDSKGNRIYDAADAFQMEDSDEDGSDKLEWKEFDDLLEARLLQPDMPA
ncbi:hypothetical protein BDV96DRAFT_614359 [Lophiotrema nucula]|uniref:DUF7357 domain-containing protein n=1 Tax=Lophiotrema nucula TaxID=690887 RepID=A0A6A5YXS1_9PLEO|nr:hypothetical protein BDV96DRAFT_614359 [Lophiotrema nucula]